MLSVELGITVALLELTLGVIAGNVFHLHTAEWLDFIAKFAAIVLTFLAGMEVDPVYMRDRAKATVGIGIASFLGPFLLSSLVSFFLIGWTLKASLIAGTALSTTSLAVVYAVLVERGLTDTGVGKLLMSATFVTDLCTALALSAIFIKPNVWFPCFSSCRSSWSSSCAHIRNDLLAVWAECRDHQQDAVLPPGDRRRPVRGRADCHRRAVVPS